MPEQYWLKVSLLYNQHLMTEELEWPSDPAEVTKLWCDQRTTCCWATSPITKIRKEGTAGDVWCLWEQWQHCQGFVKAALTRRAQGHTPRSRACHSTPDSIICAMGSQLARWIMEYFNHKAASLQTHRISPCKLANRNVRGELSFTNPYLGSKQCYKNKVFLFLKLKTHF